MPSGRGREPEGGALEAVRRAGAWALDYLYAARWQLRAALSRLDARQLLEDTDPRAVPVVLVPGIYETWQFLHPLADHLYALGHPVHAVGGLGYNHGTVEDMSAVVAAHLAEHDLRRVVLVAHSKGGLIGKHLMASSPEGGRVARMVAINTPFAGSIYARYAPVRSIRAFSPRDPGLLRLAANLEINHRIVSVYGRFDPHIPGGSRLEGAVNVQLETMGHFRPIADPRVLAAVESAVRQA